MILIVSSAGDEGPEGVGIYESVWRTELNPEVSKIFVGFVPVQVDKRGWPAAEYGCAQKK